MTTLTVQVDNEECKKLLLDILDALDLEYKIEEHPDEKLKPLTANQLKTCRALQKALDELKVQKGEKLEIEDIQEIMAKLPK